MKRLFLFLLAVLVASAQFTAAQTRPVSIAEAPGSGAWANYDFVPGHRVLAYHDFDRTYIGNFPDRITYLAGNMEVVALPDGNQVLRTQNEGRFVVPLPEALPEKFTVEFRVMATDKRSSVMMYAPSNPTMKHAKKPKDSMVALVSPAAAGLTVGKYNEGPKATQEIGGKAYIKRWAAIRIAVDGDYWKMYVDEKRVANVPQATFPRDSELGFFLSMYPYDGDDLYIDDIRIAEGGRSMLYDELQANGMVITYGILFDTGSHTLRPESTPTLMDIARLLTQHGDLSLRIEGHTDNTGDDAINQPLSQRRAEAVVAWLVDEARVDANRLEAAGYGSTRPAEANDSPEGRQANRRVELHRL